jgi:hypothetical protein
MRYSKAVLQRCLSKSADSLRQLIRRHIRCEDRKRGR